MLSVAHKKIPCHQKLHDNKKVVFTGKLERSRCVLVGYSVICMAGLRLLRKY
jgi:hypothetical protein